MGSEVVRVVVAAIAAVVAFLLVIVLVIAQTPPTITMTVSYPTLVFKPSIFEVQLSLRNNLEDSLVENILQISSGEILQLDNIPTDCHSLTNAETICDESLSFQVIEITESGTHDLTFQLSSKSWFNFPFLKEFLELSKGETNLKVPINVETPEVERVIAQSQVIHARTNWLIIVGFAFVAALLVLVVLLLILFIPEIFKIVSNLF